MAQNAPTKRCPGFAPGGIEPHELAATSENFVSNAGNKKDGLATRCRTCGNLYSKAWSAAKKAGTTFSARRPHPLSLRHPGGEPVFTASAAQVAERETPPATLVVSPGKGTPQYADELAMRADRSKAPGYDTTTVGALIYAVPTSAAAVASEEGQAALERLNAAKAADRRKRDADRKRAERAAAKERTATAG